MLLLPSLTFTLFRSQLMYQLPGEIWLNTPAKIASFLFSLPLPPYYAFSLSFITTRPYFMVILFYIFLICFAPLNVRSTWAVAALFTSVSQSPEHCLNIAGSQTFLLMNCDGEGSNGTLSSSRRCHHRDVSTLTQGDMNTRASYQSSSVYKLFLSSHREVF